MIENADEKLREAAQLWALGRRLPHLATPGEKKLIDEFKAFAGGAAPSCSLEAATAGVQDLWRRQDLNEIVRVGRLLPVRIRTDRDAGMYIAHAQELLDAATNGR
jgi:hypothetical protein